MKIKELQALLKKSLISVMTLAMISGSIGCGTKEASDEGIIGGADEPTSIVLESTINDDKKGDSTDEEADTSTDQDVASETSNGQETTSDKETTSDSTLDVSTDTAASVNKDAEQHFLEFMKGNETDANGEKFWALEDSDTEYALYDMNGDGIDELIVRAYGSWIFDILEYKDGKIQNAYVENLGSSGVSFINNKNQFVSADTGHQGRSMYVVSEIDEQYNTNLILALLTYYDDWAKSGSPEFYKQKNPPENYIENTEKFDVISEEEFNSLVEEYTQENTSIEWVKLPEANG